MYRSKQIRVLQLGSPNGLYGAERWILALVRYLDTSKITSIVSAIKDAPGLDVPLCREAESAGFQTHVFQAYGKVNFSAIKQIRTYIRKNDIDILHTHGYKTDIIGRLATIRTNCKIVSTPHGWGSDAGIKLQLYEFADRLIFPFFDTVVPLSEDIYLSLKRIPGLNHKLRLIRNGVDISEIDSVNYIADEVEVWKAAGYLIFGYIGQLIARKGLTILLQAFAKLDIPKKKLIIIGEGNQRLELEKLCIHLGINNQVDFFGFRDDRIAFLKGFDAFVLPSRLEGIPRCLMEAMAAEIPIIASDIPGCQDLVIDGETGLLFKLNEVDSLLQCLNKINKLDLRLNVARKGREFIQQHYSAKNMADKYFDLFLKMSS